MNNNDIPVWEKYTLTIEEASKYFRIGENKLRRLSMTRQRLPAHRASCANTAPNNPAPTIK